MHWHKLVLKSYIYSPVITSGLSSTSTDEDSTQEIDGDLGVSQEWSGTPLSQQEIVP